MFAGRPPSVKPTPAAARATVPVPGAATPATVAASLNSATAAPSEGKLGPDRDHMLEIPAEHVAQKWIFERGPDNIRDLLPGPILPPVIDKELLDRGGEGARPGGACPGQACVQPGLVVAGQVLFHLVR